MILNPAGKYQFTPGQTFALYPQLAAVKPYVITPEVQKKIVGEAMKKYFSSTGMLIRWIHHHSMTLNQRYRTHDMNM